MKLNTSLRKLTLGLSLALHITVSSKAQSLDVNDVSFLWPMPKTAADLEALISMADEAADGQIISDAVFKSLMEVAKKVPGNRFNSAEFELPKTWKVAGIRVNPTALGSHPMMMAKAEVPGIRMIVQPVTVSGGLAKLHDFSAHVVFNYVMPLEAGQPIKPDREAFMKVVQDLRQLKKDLNIPASPTTSLLNVHPGFSPDPAVLTGKLKGFLKKHLTSEHLDKKQKGAISFMGVPGAFEPWVFFKVEVDATAGTVTQGPINGRFEPDGPMSQMISFLPPDTAGKVLPPPLPPKVLSDVSTAVLFPALSASDLRKPLFPGTTDPKLAHFEFRDIADIAAHPQITATVTTDCVSCHTESTRRHLTPGLVSQSGTAYPIPAGISGVSPDVLPKDRWNLRNFGWGLTFDSHPDVPKGFGPTVSQRAANEAAESADFINRNYQP